MIDEGFAIRAIDSCDQSFEVFDAHVKLIYVFEVRRAHIGLISSYRGLNDEFTSIVEMSVNFNLADGCFILVLIYLMRFVSILNRWTH